MRKSTVTAVCLLLALCLLLSSCGGQEKETTPAETAEPASAEEQTDPSAQEPTAPSTAPAEEKSPFEEEKERLSALTVGEMDEATFARAICETAMAYYYKGRNTQYDAGIISVENKVTAGSRRTTGQSPEETDWDSMLYAQCAEFVYDVYLQAFGYKWINNYKGGYLNDAKYSKTVITCYAPSLGYTDLQGAADTLVKEARAGDVFLGTGKHSSGHVILVLGDIYGDGETYCLHCWPLSGGSMNDSSGWKTSEGKQYFEPNGALVIQSLDELLIKADKNPAWGVFTSKCDGSWYLFRPALEDGLREMTMLPQTVSRCLYPGLNIVKSLEELNTFSDITEGQAVTVNEVLTNNGREGYKELVVTEYVPEGAELKEPPKDAVVEGDRITWTVSLAAGMSRTLSYTVTNQKKFGETLVFEAGSADGIPTRTFSLPVAGDGFTVSQLEALKAVAAQGTPAALEPGDYQDLDIVNQFYENVLGVKTELPKTVNELVDALFKRKSTLYSDGTPMLLLKTEDGNKTLRQMLIKKHTAGFYVSTGADKSLRLMDTQAEYYKPGAVFIYFYGTGNNYRVEYPEDARIDIYLGEGKFFEYTVNGGGIVTFGESVGRILRSSVIVALRPEQAIEKTAAEVKLPEFSEKR